MPARGVDVPKILASFDARMNQVYWGAYVRDDKGLMRLSGTEVVIAPAEVPTPDDSGWVGAGSGWDQCAAVLTVRLGDSTSEWRKQVFPVARHVAELSLEFIKSGQIVTAEQALPVYVRDNVAAKMKLGQ